MKRRLLVNVLFIIFLCFCTVSCKEKNKTSWDLSFHSNYLSEACFSIFDESLSSPKKGVLTFENTNDFPILVYVYKGFLYDNVERKVKILPGKKLKYQVDKENTYYVGIKVTEAVGAFTEIGLSITSE